MKLLTTASCGHYAYTRATTGSRTSVAKAIKLVQGRPCTLCLGPKQLDEWEGAWTEERCDCHGYPCCYCTLCIPQYVQDEDDLPLYIRLYAEAGILIPHECRRDYRDGVGDHCYCGLVMRRSA